MNASELANAMLRVKSFVDELESKNISTHVVRSLRQNPAELSKFTQGLFETDEKYYIAIATESELPLQQQQVLFEDLLETSPAGDRIFHASEVSVSHVKHNSLVRYEEATGQSMLLRLPEFINIEDGQIRLPLELISLDKFKDRLPNLAEDIVDFIELQQDYREYYKGYKDFSAVLSDIFNTEVKLSKLSLKGDHQFEMVIDEASDTMSPKASIFASQVNEVMPDDLSIEASSPTRLGFENKKPLIYSNAIHLTGDFKDKAGIETKLRQVADDLDVVKFDDRFSKRNPTPTWQKFFQKNR